MFRITEESFLRTCQKRFFRTIGGSENQGMCRSLEFGPLDSWIQTIQKTTSGHSNYFSILLMEEIHQESEENFPIFIGLKNGGAGFLNHQEYIRLWDECPPYTLKTNRQFFSAPKVMFKTQKKQHSSQILYTVVLWKTILTWQSCLRVSKV